MILARVGLKRLGLANRIAEVLCSLEAFAVCGAALAAPCGWRLPLAPKLRCIRALLARILPRAVLSHRGCDSLCALMLILFRCWIRARSVTLWAKARSALRAATSKILPPAHPIGNEK